MPFSPVVKQIRGLVRTGPPQAFPLKHLLLKCVSDWVRSIWPDSLPTCASGLIRCLITACDRLSSEQWCAPFGSQALILMVTACCSPRHFLALVPFLRYSSGLLLNISLHPTQVNAFLKIKYEALCLETNYHNKLYWLEAHCINAIHSARSVFCCLYNEVVQGPNPWEQYNHSLMSCIRTSAESWGI